jgi:hypothetical protein
MNKIKLLKVQYLPIELEPGILYVSEEFEVAGHLCPCGCGSKIITPLGHTEWSFSEYKGKGTLYPSIGNWQLPCKSHYWVTNGEIQWSYKWTEEQIEAGRRAEDMRRKMFYNNKDKQRGERSFISRVIKKLFGN